MAGRAAKQGWPDSLTTIARVRLLCCFCPTTGFELADQSNPGAGCQDLLRSARMALPIQRRGCTGRSGVLARYGPRPAANSGEEYCDGHEGDVEVSIDGHGR